jgi:hypothetical protein
LDETFGTSSSHLSNFEWISRSTIGFVHGTIVGNLASTYAKASLTHLP